MSEKTICIYCDGACAGNQNEVNRGGWGAILEYGKYVREIYGGEKNTTNNRMEITALISALEALTKRNLPIHVFSDSAYVMNCMRDGWYLRWQRNGWMNSKKEPVENRDLWEKLIPYLTHYDFRFFLIKGHLNPNSDEKILKKAYGKFIQNNGDLFGFDEFMSIVKRNNRADELANIGIDFPGGE